MVPSLQERWSTAHPLYSVDEYVSHDGIGGILLRWVSYLEVAEWDHAVHHLGHAEAVPEIVKGVVSVIVMNAQLQREWMKQFLWKHTCQPPWKHSIALQQLCGAQYYLLLGQSDSTRLSDTLLSSWGRVRDYYLSRTYQLVKLSNFSLNTRYQWGNTSAELQVHLSPVTGLLSWICISAHAVVKWWL